LPEAIFDVHHGCSCGSPQSGLNPSIVKSPPCSSAHKPTAATGISFSPPSGYFAVILDFPHLSSPCFDIYNFDLHSTQQQLTISFPQTTLHSGTTHRATYQLGNFRPRRFSHGIRVLYWRSNMAAIYQYCVQAGLTASALTVRHNNASGNIGVRFASVAATNTPSPNFFMFGEVYKRQRITGGSTLVPKAGAFMLDSVRIIRVFPQQRFRFGERRDHQITGITRTSPRITTPTRRCGSSLSRQPRPAGFLNPAHQPSRRRAGVPTRRAASVLVLRHRAGVSNGANDPYDREGMFAGQFRTPITGGQF